MKSAIFFCLTLNLGALPPTVSAIDLGRDFQAAVDTLVAGVQVHPRQTVMLFQDALQSNPDCKRQLLMAAIERTRGDFETLTRLIYVARTEFPEHDPLFAAAALSVAEGNGAEIRKAFRAAPRDMAQLLAGAPVIDTTGQIRSLESGQMDEEIREAIAHMAARVAGKNAPEKKEARQSDADRNPDQIRFSPKFATADESRFNATVALDRIDGHDLSPGPVRLDDSQNRGDGTRRVPLKSSSQERTASISPLKARTHSMRLSGAVAHLEEPKLRPASHRLMGFPGASGGGDFQSTLDLETSGTLCQSLIIRPVPASPTPTRSSE